MPKRQGAAGASVVPVVRSPVVFSQRLRERLAARGIRLSEPFSLEELDDAGRVIGEILFRPRGKR